MVSYGYSYPSYGSIAGTATFTLIALVIAIAAAIVIYCVFMKNDNEKKLNGFTKTLYDFLHFRNFIIVDFVKIAYIFAAIFITLFSFSLIAVNFLGFLMVLVFGNVIIRIAFEAFMVMYSIYENTKSINKKIK